MNRLYSSHLRLKPPPLGSQVYLRTFVGALPWNIVVEVMPFLRFSIILCLLQSIDIGFEGRCGYSGAENWYVRLVVLLRLRFWKA